MEGVPIEDTMLSDMCPDIESAFCFPHKYRTINGECNNVKNPTWGITGAAYLRILQPTYQDGGCRCIFLWFCTDDCGRFGAIGLQMHLVMSSNCTCIAPSLDIGLNPRSYVQASSSTYPPALLHTL